MKVVTVSLNSRGMYSKSPLPQESSARSGCVARVQRAIKPYLPQVLAFAAGALTGAYFYLRFIHPLDGGDLVQLFNEN